MSAHGFGALDRTTGALVSYVNDDVNYRGGDSTDWDGTYRTLIGRAATNKNTEYWRAAARKNGSGWLCCTMRHISVVKILFEIIFGTRHASQAITQIKTLTAYFRADWVQVLPICRTGADITAIVLSCLPA